MAMMIGDGDGDDDDDDVLCVVKPATSNATNFIFLVPASGRLPFCFL